MGFVIRNGIPVGAMMGEERDDKFMDLMIRQIYNGERHSNITKNEWGDNSYSPTAEIEDRWKAEYGGKVGLFQLNRVRESEDVCDKLIEWINHSADIEGKKLFIIDNLMKLTAMHKDEEFVAQGKIIEQLYRVVDKKNIHIILVAHTKKIDGLMDGNSISGSKKLMNTPDNFIMFQRLDRYTEGKNGVSRDEAKNNIAMKAGIIPLMSKKDSKEKYTGPNFTSYLTCYKIRDRSAGYSTSTHVCEYDPKSTLTYELLPKLGINVSIYEDGYSKILSNKPII